MPNGSLATVEQSSPDADREAIAQLVLTRPGERPLVPGYGMTDPTFRGFEPTELAAGLAMFGPPVELADVDVAIAGEDAQAVTIEFV